MQRHYGKNNNFSVFGAGEIPSDNHIRSQLDDVPGEQFAPLYEWVSSALERSGKLEVYEMLRRRLQVGIDGIQHFSSAKIHYQQCSCSEGDGKG